MKLRAIYDFVIKHGMERDPRGKQGVKKDLTRVKKLYDSLKPKDKSEFDEERLTNPYSDTRLLYGDKNKEIKTILIGIDMEGTELLLADRLKEKGTNIDLVMSHHPEGRALAGLYDVMHMQIDILSNIGVPVNVAEDLTKERIREVARKIMSKNHLRAVDTARLLDIPFISVHTPADNCVASYLQGLMDKRKPGTVRDVVKILKEIPEYKQAVKEKAGPKVVIGREDRQAGKVFVEMTGGTEGAKGMFEKLAQAGVGTIVAMHFSEEHLKKVKKAHINVVIAGHIASDTLGLNLLFDALEKKGKINIIPCSGFRRITRAREGKR